MRKPRLKVTNLKAYQAGREHADKVFDEVVVPALVERGTITPAMSEREKEKRENFKRLAKARTEQVLEELRKLGNLSSANYVYTEEEVIKVFAVVDQAVDHARKRFTQQMFDGVLKL